MKNDKTPLALPEIELSILEKAELRKPSENLVEFEKLAPFNQDAELVSRDGVGFGMAEFKNRESK